MDIIEFIGLAFIGIVAFLLQWKRDFRFVGFLNLLLAISIVLFLKHFIDTSNQAQLYALIAILGLNFVTGQLKIFQNKGLRILIPLLSFVVFFVAFKSDSVIILDEEYAIVNKFIIGGVLLSLFAFEIGAIKEFIFVKIFKGLENAEIEKSVTILLMAFSIFLGGFASASFGLLLIATAFTISSFYRKDESQCYSVSLLTLPVLAVLLSLTGEIEVNLLDSDVLEGLFIGVFGAYFINRLWQTTNRFVLIVGYLLLGIFSAGLLFLQTIYGQMGGMDAFIGILIGTAIVNIIKGREYVGQTIFVLLLFIGLFVSSFLLLEENNMKVEITEDTSKNDPVEETVPLIPLDLNELKGAFELNQSSSNISFFLGKKGETKGKFTKVAGEFIFGENIQNTNFSIELKLENISTFNSFRDETLMEDDYFKADKFPIMTYKGNKLTALGDDQYELNGKFMMLGVVKDIIVTLKGFEKEGKSILVGKGEIDRREFGMTPSATEGNIVAFEYEVELK